MLSDEYKASLNKWIGGGPKPRTPKNLEEMLANCGASLVLRNQELFQVHQQLPRLLNGLELEIPPGVDFGSLR